MPSRPYFQLPEASLSKAKSVMLDWNISTRITTIHNAQLEGKPHKLDIAVIERMRGLAENIPPHALLVTAIGAAEPELNLMGQVFNTERHGNRADAPALYLGEWRDYLLHLLDGGASERRELPAAGVRLDSSVDALRPWLTIGYAALLKAVQLSLDTTQGVTDRFDAYRFWLEHELQGLPSREAWVGFLLLGGMPAARQVVAHFLKTTDTKKSRAHNTWGAAWDLAYTRLVGMTALPSFASRVTTPLTFVSDDAHLADVIRSINPVGLQPGTASSMFVAEAMDAALLQPAVVPVLEDYARRERRRVSTYSEGATNKLMRRARYEATRLERAYPELGYPHD
jgi:hypothetical protein